MSSSFDAARNLALEEGLLARGGEALERGEGFLLLYVDDPCILIGRNQNPWAEAGLSAVPLFRRVSGGGSVWHDRGNLNWALVVPRNAHDREAELALVAGAVSGLGAKVLPGERGGLFAAEGTSDPGAKLAGTARRFSPTAVLHHGTLLVESDLARLREASQGLRLPSSRALASVPSRVANLSDLVPGLGLEAAKEGLVEALCGVDARPLPIESLVSEDADLAAAMARHHSWDWVYGETPDFAYEIPGSPSRLVIVKRGLVAAIEGPCVDKLADRIGTRFDPRLWEGA